MERPIARAIPELYGLDAANFGRLNFAKKHFPVKSISIEKFFELYELQEVERSELRLLNLRISSLLFNQWPVQKVSRAGRPTVLRSKMSSE